MKRFMSFITKVKNKERAVFFGKVIFFYLILLGLWLYYMVTRDSGAPAFIYEQF